MLRGRLFCLWLVFKVVLGFVGNFACLLGFWLPCCLVVRLLGCLVCCLISWLVDGSVGGSKEHGDQDAQDPWIRCVVDAHQNT